MGLILPDWSVAAVILIVYTVYGITVIVLCCYRDSIFAVMVIVYLLL